MSYFLGAMIFEIYIIFFQVIDNEFNKIKIRNLEFEKEISEPM